MSKRIVRVKPAGEYHQVVSVTGDGRREYCKKPCGTCPWRKDAIGEFPAEAFRHSASTAYDMSDQVFACHTAGVDQTMTCAGFLLNGSAHNLSIRLALMRGDVDLSLVSDGGNELFDSYRAMAEANGVEADDLVLRHCRES